MMRRATFCILLAFTLLVVCTSGHEEEEPHLADIVDRSDWIDPGDMLNYDHTTKTMKKPKGGPKIEKHKPHKTPEPSALKPDLKKKILEKLVSSEELKACKESLKACSTSPIPCISDKSTCPRVEETGMVFYKRHVRKLMSLFSKPIPPGEYITYTATVQFSEPDLKSLEKFVDSAGDANIQDATEVLDYMISGVSLRNPNNIDAARRFEEIFGIDPTLLLQVLAVITMAVFLVFLETKLGLSWRQQLWRICVLSFFISIPWTWLHLYKKALSKKQAEVHKDIPIQCRPQDMDWKQSLATWWSQSFSVQDDPCTKYHESLLVNPVLEVTPTQALAVTVTKFFLEPAGHIGEAISKFFRGIFQELPFQHALYISVIVVFLIVLITIMSFSYRIRLPFFLNLEPPHADALELQRLRNQVQEGNNQIKRLEGIVTEQQACIAAPPLQDRVTDIPMIQAGQARAATPERNAPQGRNQYSDDGEERFISSSLPYPIPCESHIQELQAQAGREGDVDRNTENSTGLCETAGSVRDIEERQSTVIPAQIPDNAQVISGATGEQGIPALTAVDEQVDRAGRGNTRDNVESEVRTAQAAADTPSVENVGVAK